VGGCWLLLLQAQAGGKGGHKAVPGERRIRREITYTTGAACCQRYWVWESCQGVADKGSGMGCRCSYKDMQLLLEGAKVLGIAYYCHCSSNKSWA
jgi:hypothetical protein